MNRAVLFSGGLDSLWLRTFVHDADLFYFNLHTRYSRWEIDGLDEAVKVIDVDVAPGEVGEAAEVFNRNLFLLARLALEHKDIFIGSTADDTKFDNSFEFLFGLQTLLKGGATIHAPLKLLRKQLIWNHLACTLREVEYRTCYSPMLDGSRCGTCPACTRDDSIVKWVPRDAVAADIPAIYELSRLALGESFDPSINDDFEGCDQIKLATVHGQIVGCVAITGLSIINVRVHPDYHRKGIYNALLAMVIKENERRGQLWGLTKIESTLPIHMSQGVVPHKEADGYWYWDFPKYRQLHFRPGATVGS